LLVSIIKGLVPIYLLEAVGWAGLAWYWQKKNTHSELAKAIVIVLAVLVAIGEVVHIVSQLSSEPKQTAADTSHHLDDLFPASTPPSQRETQNKANSAADDPFAKYIVNPSQGETYDKPKQREGTRAGLEATITCDNTVWDRDKYGEGNPLAITNVHKGDVVQYVGHVTVGDEDIIRVHGRKGYVDGCVDVKLTQGAGNSDEAQEPKPRKEKRAGLEATITCDNIVWDRDKYGEGDPLAITNVHKGDVVQYVGHVTVGDEDIIRVHGRKGYVEGCVDVKQ
jgi:hypothetical protein